jgi:phytoene dehydrogenase-like protein
VIIGGGAAGLAAAYELVGNGCTPIILEKTGSLGGLARTESYIARIAAAHFTGPAWRTTGSARAESFVGVALSKVRCSACLSGTPIALVLNKANAARSADIGSQKLGFSTGYG